MKLNYMLLDVFTTQRLKGNPLAVVLKADGLLDDQMQAIAAEFNLSETVFIQKAQSERHAAAVRIFTPTVELPFAGHPTVGAAVVLGLQNRSSAVRLEEKVGVITCVIERVDKDVGLARFALPRLPEEVGKVPAVGAIAATLGLEPEEIGCGPYQPALFSAGVPYYLLPVRDAAALKRIRLERRGWDETFSEGRGSIYVFTQTPEEPENDLAARMFSPRMEDPATGSAAAALIGLIARHTGNGQHELRLRQGHEMGRPSLITLQLRKDDDKLTHGGIGGHAVIVGEGTLNLGD
ncbi:MAG TPA: PhzF family phenazine biosynthesis protein [Devosia sp.]|jgi:trans-2,3-dihydro-3-hydroxyanthranilate isomerase|uniref:PhzF family phenazine biosynthesis protein n=1 Tax=Devosia sp. TaxID=1871048 RepID=UPI002DDCD3E6|nr:PhzF family phenazine biosynthesis protein [Devosia sp.]HEV2515091.1 PhzF family phenazine biosynthesis protein [Devosia sp.]